MQQVLSLMPDNTLVGVITFGSTVHGVCSFLARSFLRQPFPSRFQCPPMPALFR